MVPKIFNIAILEDEDSHFEFLKKTLADVPLEFGLQYKIERYDSISEATQKLFGRTPDLLLIDLNLIDSSGYDTFQTAKLLKVPMVVMSALDDHEIAFKCIKEGTSYILKDWMFTFPLILHFILLRAYEVSQHRERIKVLIRERLGEFKQLIPRCKFCIPRIGEPRFKDESTHEWFTFTGYAENIGIKFTDGICGECFDEMRKVVESNGH